jgi:hypothetical protein
MPWSAEYEKKLYNQLYKTADTLLSSEVVKEQIVGCEILKLKQQAPNGLESLQPDTEKKMIYNIGMSCASEIKDTGLKKWTPEYEEIIKRELMQSPFLKELKDSVRYMFCDCYVNSLKLYYPVVVNEQIPEKTQLKIAKNCANKLNLHFK